jgi:hypothetical protein
VALDRAVKLARDTGREGAESRRWALEAQAIRDDVLSKGWSERKQTFVQHYESEARTPATCSSPSWGSYRRTTRGLFQRWTAYGASWTMGLSSTAIALKRRMTAWPDWRGPLPCAASGWSSSSHVWDGLAKLVTCLSSS